MNKILFAFIFFISAFFSSCFNCKDNYSNEKSKLIKVSIINKYRDDENHNERTIEYYSNSGNIEVHQTRYIPSLYENISIGDSLIKEKGSLAYQVKKKDTTLVFYPICHGDTMK